MILGFLLLHCQGFFVSQFKKFLPFVFLTEVLYNATSYIFIWKPSRFRSVFELTREHILVLINFKIY